MIDKKYKSKDEWKNLINELSPQEFQDLCYDVLNNNNFSNVKPRGKGGDGGRDLEGQFIFNLAKETISQKCWFQCKRYGSSALNYREFNTEVQKAENEGVDRFIVISNKDMTSSAKTDIENWNKKSRCQISDWTGTLFLDLLFELPNICKTYFSDEEVPPVVNSKDVKEVIPLSNNLGNRFGIELNINAKNIDPNNIEEVSTVLKNALLNLKTDINLQSMIYEKSSLFFFSIGKIEDALVFLNKSLDITPKNPNALLTKGYILEKSGKLEESNEAYDEIFEIEEDNLLALNNKAHNLLRLGELDDALKLADRALELNPNFILAIKNKVKILKALKREEEALLFLSEKEEFFDKSTELILEKIDICIEKLDLREAFRLNEELLKKDSENLNALNNQGVIYERNARFQLGDKYAKLALESFENVISKNKNYPLGWSNKMVILMGISEIDEAEKIIDEAYVKFPSSPEVINKKGVLLLKKGEPRKALKYFNSALKNFYKGEYLLNRSSAKYQMNHYLESLNDLDRLLKNEPKNSKAWGIKGECLKILRRPLSKQAFDNAKKYVEVPVSLLEDEKVDEN